jgi:hypothetical protein
MALQIVVLVHSIQFLLLRSVPVMMTHCLVPPRLASLLELVSLARHLVPLWLVSLQELMSLAQHQVPPWLVNQLELV